MSRFLPVLTPTAQRLQDQAAEEEDHGDGGDHDLDDKEPKGLQREDQLAGDEDALVQKIGTLIVDKL